MRAARIIAPGRAEMVETPVPAPGENQVLVKLEGCGVCASNIPPWEGRDWFRYPMEPGALGHEGWGYVYALGSNADPTLEGKRVALLSQHAYAEYDIADTAGIVPLPPALDGIPFPGEPLGCAINIYARSGVRAGQAVAIVGMGFLGMLLARLAAHDGARVIAIARHESALETARRFGAAETVEMEDHRQIIEHVKHLTAGIFCDVVIEATGKQWPLQLAGELTRERGRLVIAGYHQDGMREINVQLWNWRGIDVINAHERDPAMYVEGIRRAAAAVAAGIFDPRPLFTQTFSLDRLKEALNAARDRPGAFMKALITSE